MSVREGPRRQGSAHPIRNTAVLGGVAVGGAAIAGAAAAGVAAVGAIAATAVVAVAGVVGIKALVRKTRRGIQNHQANRQQRRQQRQERIVRNGGRRHGVGGAVLDAAAGNPGLLAFGATAAGIGLLTSTPFLLVGGAAIGTGILIRNLLRNRAQARGIPRQPGTLSQAVQAIRDRAEIRQAFRQSDILTDRARTPEQPTSPERRAPATVAASAEGPATGAVSVVPSTSVGSHYSWVYGTSAPIRTAQAGASRVSQNPPLSRISAPAEVAATAGNPTDVKAVASVTSLADFKARKEAQAATAVEPVTTQVAPERRRAPGLPGPGVPAGVPVGPGRRGRTKIGAAA